jgi:formylglycine-generating enzyme required for sulfatase activity
MKRTTTKVLLALGIVIVVLDVAAAAVLGSSRFPARCGADAVVAGTVCLDRYEASVWRVPNPTTTNVFLVRRIEQGNATRADLMAGGATQLGTASDDYAPCASNGQNCAKDIYAVSLPSEVPSAHITWFQAQEACANALKRLPTSAEWQVGANGTPDPGPHNGTPDCNTASALALGDCVSARAAVDMVGSLYEWVADWAPRSTRCPNWGSFSDDEMCISGASMTANGPGALLRGGGFDSGANAGPLAVLAAFAPSFSDGNIGFRCAR